MNDTTTSNRRPTTSILRTLWVGSGSILLLATLVWGTFSVVSLLAREQMTEHHLVPAEGLTMVRIDSDNGWIEVRGGDVDEVQVTAHVSHGLRRTDVGVEVTDSTLGLSATCPLFGSDWCWVNFDVVVPREMDLAVRSENDRVVVLDLDGATAVHTTNGRVELSALGGPIDVSSPNGRIEALGLTSTAVQARADNGRIELSFVEPPRTLRVRADNGRIGITVPHVDGGYAIDARHPNGSANVSVTNDPASPRSISARADNGSITIQPPG